MANESLRKSSMTDPSPMSTSAPVEVRFTLLLLPGTRLVQIGPSTVIDADDLVSAFSKDGPVKLDVRPNE